MARLLPFAFLRLGALLTSAVAACSPSTPANVVLLTLDTVRADSLGHLGGREGGTPNLDELAAGGVTFRDAWAPRGQTWPSLATLLTGRLPLAHGVRENGFPLSPAIPTLAESFRRAGFRTGAFLSNACEAWGANRFDYLECSISVEELSGDQSRLQATWDRRSVDRALDWLDGGAGPAFVWVHLFDAHKPFPTVPKLRGRFVERGYRGPFRAPKNEPSVGHAMPFHDKVEAVAHARSVPSDEDLAAIRAYYAAGVFGVDRNVGRLVRGLSERGLLEASLLVVAADHGEELFDHASIPYHSASVHGSGLRVPMIYSWPGRLRAGHVVDVAVGLEDIAPTILELCDLSPIGDMEGRSLADALRGGTPAPHALFAEAIELDRTMLRQTAWSNPEVEGEVHAVRSGSWRLVWNPDQVVIRSKPFDDERGLVHATALFDLDSDPGETVDVSDAHPEVVAELVELLESRLAELRAAAPNPIAPDLSVLVTLEKLGYLGERE